MAYTRWLLRFYAAADFALPCTNMDGRRTCQEGGWMSADPSQATEAAGHQSQSFAPPLVDDRLNQHPRPEQIRG